MTADRRSEVPGPEYRPSRRPRENRRLRRGDLSVLVDLSALPEGATLDEILDVVCAEDEPLAEVKSDARTRVVVLRSGEREWVLKSYALRGLRDRLRALLRRGKAHREWRASERLAVAGLRVARHVALASRPVEGGFELLLVAPRVARETLYDYMKRGAPPRERLRVARAVGRQVAAMASLGFANRDHKPSNLMIDRSVSRGGAEPILIDVDGIVSPSSPALVQRMLRSLARGGPRERGAATRREALAALLAARRGAALGEALPRDLAAGCDRRAEEMPSSGI